MDADYLKMMMKMFENVIDENPNESHDTYSITNGVYTSPIVRSAFCGFCLGFSKARSLLTKEA